VEPSPISATSIPASMGKTIYPEPYASLVKGRLTHLAPGAVSALAHSHSKQDEFIFIVEGHLTLLLGEAEFTLNPGDCYGFRAGTGIVHQLVNQSEETVTYLEIGDRTEGDEVNYPNDDLKATQLAHGEWVITHKDGRGY
jgi:uncharacterized cupin superfamily protein